MLHFLAVTFFVCTTFGCFTEFAVLDFDPKEKNCRKKPPRLTGEIWRHPFPAGLRVVGPGDMIFPIARDDDVLKSGNLQEKDGCMAQRQSKVIPMTGPEKVVMIRSIVLLNDCFTPKERLRVMEFLSGSKSEACLDQLVDRCLSELEKRIPSLRRVTASRSR